MAFGLGLQSSFEALDNAGDSGDRPTADHLQMPDADVSIFRQFFDRATSDNYFSHLLATTQWRQDQIRWYGKVLDLPRLTAWHCDEDKSYRYSGIQVFPEPWTPVLLEIKQKIEDVSGVTFNSVLLNRYRNGRDSVSWHSDDEPELGTNPVIGSVSFGVVRPFQMRHKVNHKLGSSIPLAHGSYLLMKGPTQHFWSHQIPKSSTNVGERINLTFRRIQ